MLLKKEKRIQKILRKPFFFNIACPVSESNDDELQHKRLCPIVDGGGEYSALGTVELKLIFEIDVNDKLHAMPSALNGHTNWQYGQGEHASYA